MKRKFDKDASERIANAVAEIEKNTDAELVIVIRARSGSYRHADYLFGAIVAFLGLLFALFSPFVIPAIVVPIDVALMFVIGAFVSSRTSVISAIINVEEVSRQHGAPGRGGDVLRGRHREHQSRKRSAGLRFVARRTN